MSFFLAFPTVEIQTIEYRTYYSIVKTPLKRYDFYRFKTKYILLFYYYETPAGIICDTVYQL